MSVSLLISSLMCVRVLLVGPYGKIDRQTERLPVVDGG